MSVRTDTIIASVWHLSGSRVQQPQCSHNAHLYAKVVRIRNSCGRLRFLLDEDHRYRGIGEHFRCLVSEDDPVHSAAAKPEDKLEDLVPRLSFNLIELFEEPKRYRWLASHA